MNTRVAVELSLRIQVGIATQGKCNAFFGPFFVESWQNIQCTVLHKKAASSARETYQRATRRRTLRTVSFDPMLAVHRLSGRC